MAKKLHELYKYSSKKIKIIDFYLTHQNNSCVEISKKMGISIHFANMTINEWFENDKTIIVASKI